MALRILAGLLAYLVVILGQAGDVYGTANRLPLLMAGGPAGGGAATPSVTFLQCTSDDTDQTTYTFSSQNTGTASADRITIVGIVTEAGGSRSVSTVTVGGDSATEWVDFGNMSTNTGLLLVNAAIYSLANTADTSESVVVTASSGATSATICLWQANNINATASYWAAQGGLSGTVAPVNHFTKGESGISVGVCVNVGTVNSSTWAGLTERADAASGEHSYSAADFTDNAVVDSPLTASCDASGIGNGVAAAAHWGTTAPSDPTLASAGCTADDNNATTYTYTNHSISTAAANRVVVVGIMAEDSAAAFTITNTTFGGVAGLEASDEAGTGVVNTALWYHPIASGTTSTIAVTASEALAGSMVICVWALYDVASIYPYTENISDDDTASGALLLTHNTITKGISLGVCNNSGVADAATWAELSERTDTQSAEQDYSNADFTEDAGAASVGATCDWTGGNDASGSLAHWR